MKRNSQTAWNSGSRFADAQNSGPTFPLNFNDDEPLLESPPATTTMPKSGLEKVSIETFTELPAIAASDSNPSFSVLLGIRAPPLPGEVSIDSEEQRVPIDLVAVLDVSGSMRGEKLSLLKFATKFVIDHMLPCDRLSIVEFSSNARRVLPLCRMTEKGRKDAEFAVDLLRDDGGTNIVEGLNMGAQVLEQRRERNPVSSIIFLSDGQDTCNSSGVYNTFSSRNHSRPPPAYLRKISSSVSGVNNTEVPQGQRFPVYTFGVGTDHDAVAMNAIADGSGGGTYSFVESAEMIPRSFATCIGGLFSVVAQDVRVVVYSASPGVEIKSIPSGRHKNEINSEQKQGTIHVGDLFAEEKKEFLVYLSVPSHSNHHMLTVDETVIKTPLLDVVCYYRNAFTGETEQIEGPSIEIPRPMKMSSSEKVVNLVVDVQKNRVEVAESIAKAKEMADKGKLEEAKEMLTKSRETLLASASAQSGADVVTWLETELHEITERMASMDLYACEGAAYMLSGLSAHGAQRAAARNAPRNLMAMMGRRGGRGSGGRGSGRGGFAMGKCSAPYETRKMHDMQCKLENSSNEPNNRGGRKNNQHKLEKSSHEPNNRVVGKNNHIKFCYCDNVECHNNHIKT